MFLHLLNMTAPLSYLSLRKVVRLAYSLYHTLRGKAQALCWALSSVLILIDFLMPAFGQITGKHGLRVTANVTRLNFSFSVDVSLIKKRLLEKYKPLLNGLGFIHVLPLAPHHSIILWLATCHPFAEAESGALSFTSKPISWKGMFGFAHKWNVSLVSEKSVSHCHCSNWQ